MGMAMVSKNDSSISWPTMAMRAEAMSCQESKLHGRVGGKEQLKKRPSVLGVDEDLERCGQ